MSRSKDLILSNLNAPQREAVETLDGPLLILAGAGSGKTRVVTRRIANLIYEGRARPWEILAITFTNKAAGEMRKRVEDIVGEAGVWLSTFHSFCARILRREAEILGLSRDFTIYDTDDTNKVLRDVVKELNVDDKRYQPNKMRGMISMLKAKTVSSQEMDGVSYHERVVQQIYQQYEKVLTQNQALDFDDLLLKGVQLFRDHVEIQERYRERFRYVLVDEYQDTNGCQYELVKLLGAAHRNVCATGDPDQSIYAWRGADVRNILSFEKDFPEARVVRLEQNYRSTKRILAVAQAVIEHNTQRRERDLWTENTDGEKVTQTVLSDAELEAHEVAKRIDEMVTSGKARYGDLAIFYRTNAQSRPFENALLQAAIPYQLIGGTPFYERREVKDMLSYLRLMLNPRDDVSLARIINVPRRGIGAKTVEVLAQHAGALGCSMLEAMDHTEWMERELRPKARKELYAFARMMDALRAMPHYPVAACVKRVVEDTGMIAALEAENESERVENIEQLINAAAVYDTENDPALLARQAADPTPEPGAFDGPDDLAQRQASIAGFLENAALMASVDTMEDDTDRVTLMTLHMAKGLEYPYVFMAGLEEGLLPMVRGSDGFSQGVGARDDAEENDEKSQVEEERRLFYVGVTRAQKQLWFLRATNRLRYGKNEATVPSRFLDEVPDELMDLDDRARPSWAGGGVFRDAEYADDRRGRSSFGSGGSGGRSRSAKGDPFADFEAELDEIARPGRSKAYVEPDDQLDEALDFAGRVIDTSTSQLAEEGFDIGDMVRHHKFGNGTVLSFSGQGLSRKVVVQFARHGKKQLLLSLARLQRVN